MDLFELILIIAVISFLAISSFLAITTKKIFVILRFSWFMKNPPRTVTIESNSGMFYIELAVRLALLLGFLIVFVNNL